MVATILRDAPYSGLYLMFYTHAKDSAKNVLVNNKNSTHSSHSFHPSSPSISTRLIEWLPQSTVHFACSIAAGVRALACTQPPDVVKTRMQLHPGRHRHVGAAFLHVYRSNGFRGFFAGFVPRTLRRTLMAAATWTLYEQLMSWMGLT